MVEKWFMVYKKVSYMKLKNSLISCAYIETILRLLIHSNSTPFGVGGAVNSFSFFLRIASGANNLKVFNPFGINKINYRNNPK